jgi:fructose-1,6-bisphosphatase I
MSNASIGTIFGIYRRRTPAGPGTVEDCLQPGRDLAAAGYIIYGSSTMMVYTTGNGVHGFTLDPGVGEFLLSHPNIRIPAEPKYYSVNQGNEKYWSEGVRRYTRWLQGMDEENPRKPLSGRYIGSLVADFHRNLLEGGVFYYPQDYKDPNKPKGKLRLLYEAGPSGLRCRTCRGVRFRWAAPHPGHRPRDASPEDGSLYRQPGPGGDGGKIYRPLRMSGGFGCRINPALL